MYVCGSAQYGPVKHWVHCKSITHPPTKLACVRYWIAYLEKNESSSDTVSDLVSGT